MTFRRLAGNALSGVAQVVFSALVLFELYRFLAAHLSMSEIGLWSLVMASTAVARLSECGLGGGVVKFVAADMGAGDRASAARTIGMAALLVAAFMIAICLVLYPILPSLLRGAIPEDAWPLAMALLPWALASLAAAGVANVFLGALDGLQRSDLRAGLQVGASLVQLTAAYAIVPAQGVAGLGLVQFVQAGSLLVASTVVAIVCLRQPIGAWIGFDRVRVRELMRYGGGIQVAAIGQLLFEPTVKGLLAVFGGLSFTGYYEMANRMMLQFRAVIVSAYNALVPYIAGRIAQTTPEPADLRRIYLAAYRLLVVLAAPYYALVGAALPVLLSVWLGRFDPQFLAVAVILWIGWAANTMVGPAYFLYLAIGRLRWTVWTQFAIGALNVLLASIGGALWGGYGVLAGSALALAAGSYVAVAAFHLEFRVAARELLPPQSHVLVTVCFVGAAAILTTAGIGEADAHRITLLAAATATLGVLLALIAWRHPLRADVMRRLRPEAA